MKRKEWIPFVSLGVFLAVMNLTIAAFGFERIDRLDARIDRIEARIEGGMDRIEERLSRLEQRVSRIEGVLMLRVERADAGVLRPDDGPEEPEG